MLSFLRKNSRVLNIKSTCDYLKSINHFVMFNHTKTKLKEEKYSYQKIEELINNLMNQEIRNMHNLPEEFHKYFDRIIYLEKPVEPEEYECCGKGCSPCVWDRYDNKVRDFQNVIEMLYDKLNNDD